MKSIKVLLADDQKHPRQELKSALIEKGLNVVGEASDGREVIDLNDKLKPEIIIMEVKMPVLNGIDASTVIMSKSEVPIILLTVKDDPDTIDRAKKAGVMGYMIKPFNKKELLPIIEITISRFNELKTLRKECGDLKDTLEARKIIDRAKRFLMEKNQIEEKGAFRKIQQLSMNKNISMKEIAKSIIISSEL